MMQSYHKLGTLNRIPADQQASDVLRGIAVTCKNPHVNLEHVCYMDTSVLMCEPLYTLDSNIKSFFLSRLQRYIVVSANLKFENIESSHISVSLV